VPGRLKMLADRMLGPNADAAIVEELIAARKANQEVSVPFRVDDRVLKPRVAGFIAVGGSLTEQWKALTLPLLHVTTFSMQMAVVDQVQFSGAGTPRSIVLDSGALDRAARLGYNVAAQMGRPFEETVYRGDRPGLCPMCHLDVVVLRGRDVECATCGARGELTSDFSVRWTDTNSSVIGMSERRNHYYEIRETAKRQMAQRAEIEQRAAVYAEYDCLVRPPR
jgi:Zn-finger nucleic acid-binding protein